MHRWLRGALSRPSAGTTNTASSTAGPAPRSTQFRVWHCPKPLDVEPMHAAAQLILGKHDFTTFRAAECQAKSPVKTLDRLDVSARGRDRSWCGPRARSFLHSQVRSMVGSLKLVGEGKWTPHAVPRRARCDATAAAACAAGATRRAVPDQGRLRRQPRAEPRRSAAAGKTRLIMPSPMRHPDESARSGTSRSAAALSVTMSRAILTSMTITTIAEHHQHEDRELERRPPQSPPTPA